MKNKKRRIAKGLALAVMVVCLLRIGQIYLESLKHKTQQEELKGVADSSLEIGVAEKPPLKMEVVEKPSLQSSMPEGANETIPQNQPMPKYVALQEENKDLVGWISIEGTKIDYPVMQSGDDEYYLHHDFYGEDSKYGCLYVRGQADLNTGTNFVIYGHNMKDGAMFGDLDLYLEESFYKEHPTISFDTLYEERIYDIMSVFLSQVYDKEDDVFKYYRFYKADTQEDFADFYDPIKKLSFYDTGVMAQFGDTFLTLSTCAYHVEDGRLVVVAKRRK